MNAMAGKTKTAKKKRKVSKHVLQARSDAAEPQNMDASKQSEPKKKQKKNKHAKAPSDAANYLVCWKNRKSGEGIWKFNKNTQSWLIRHCYETDKVSKGTFGILLNYLDGLEGATTRSRIRAEANRRALRYKEHIKNASAVEEDIMAKNEEEESKNNFAEKSKSRALSSEDLLEEEKKWKGLDEHERRKEYKRARKVLETITAK
jgi:hypothetical protein